jgi:predicted aspartyl protease
MASFTARTLNLEKNGAIFDIIVLPSINFLKVNNIQNPEFIQIPAMIDTGASCSVIQSELLKIIGISPIGLTSINTPSSENVPCNKYDVQLMLPNHSGLSHSIVVIEAPLKGQNIKFLIGRDVLKNGILIYNGYDNSFTLSF